jgi:hypothetical protein
MATKIALIGCLAFLAGAASAAAQPELSLSTTVVTPGESVVVTVSGTPGQFLR